MSKEVKLEEKELAELKEANVALDRYKLAIVDLEMQKKSLYESVTSLQQEFTQMENKLIEKYGKDSVINMNTGIVKQKTDE